VDDSPGQRTDASAAGSSLGNPLADSSVVPDATSQDASRVDASAPGAERGDAGAEGSSGRDGSVATDAGLSRADSAASPSDAGAPEASSISYDCGSSASPVFSLTIGGIGYQLTWNDEFNGTALDSANWNVSDGGWCCGVGPNLPQNVSLGGGCLVLRSDRTNGGTGYSSAWVDTQGKFQWTRGYIEIRAQLPKGQGMWPALWTDEIGGNPMAEFDILEMLGNVPSTVYETNHLWPQDGGPGTQVHQCTFSGPDFSAGFHVFGFQMQPSAVTWYIDGAQTCATTQGVNSNPVYLMVNTAVGGAGSWPGAPDSTTVFPNFMDVDYVRVYE